MCIPWMCIRCTVTLFKRLASMRRINPKNPNGESDVQMLKATRYFLVVLCRASCIIVWKWSDVRVDWRNTGYISQLQLKQTWIRTGRASRRDKMWRLLRSCFFLLCKWSFRFKRVMRDVKWRCNVDGTKVCSDAIEDEICMNEISCITFMSISDS